MFRQTKKIKAYRKGFNKGCIYGAVDALMAVSIAVSELDNEDLDRIFDEMTLSDSEREKIRNEYFGQEDGEA